MFSIMENETGVLLPVFLKKLLILSGFDNPSAFYEYNENDVKELESFATKEIFDRADRKTIETIYAEAYPANFEQKLNQKSFFLAKGHKKTIMYFAKTCVNNIQNITERFKGFLQRTAARKEAKKDKSKNPEKDRKRKSSNVTQLASQLPTKKRNMDNEKAADDINSPDENKEISKTKTEEHIKNIAINYVKRVTSKMESEAMANTSVNTILQDIKNITVKNVNKDLSKLKCGIGDCQVVLNITSVKGSSGTNWITSNFNKHLKKVHLKPSVVSLTKSTEKSDYENGMEKNKQTSMLNYIEIKDPTSSDSQTRVNLDSEARCSENLSLISSNSIATSTAVATCIYPETDSSYIENQFPDLFFAKSRGSTEATASAEENISPQIRKSEKWKTDLYSRHERNLRKLSYFDEKQQKITDFFELLREINEEINKPELKKMMENDNNSTGISSKQREIDGLLKDLMESYVNNQRSASSHANRYTEHLKKISLYIFLIGGPLLYQTLHANFSNVLPSITSVRQSLHENPKIKEGELRLNDLKKFLIKRNLPLKVFISEDQTAIIRRVQYDAKENRLVGFKTDISKDTGLPNCNNFYVNSYNDIETAFNDNSICSNAFTVVAQPMADKAPSFVLAIFGSDNKFSYEDVINRWSYIEEQACILGIEIEGYATDGDTRALKAMRLKSRLPLLETNKYSPYYCVSITIKSRANIQL